METAKNRLSVADILGAKDTQYKEIEIPEWPVNGKPGVLRLRSLSAADAQQFQEKEASKDSATLVLVLSVVDDEDKPLFTPADIQRLREKSLKVILRIQDEALKLNGLHESQKATTKNA